MYNEKKSDAEMNVYEKNKISLLWFTLLRFMQIELYFVR